MRTLMLLLALLPCGLADITVQYHNEVSQPGGSPGGLIPDTMIRIKGNHGLATMGTFTLLLDFSKQEITILNPAQKSFATLPAADYRAKVTAAFGDAGPAESIKDFAESFLGVEPRAQSRKTGRREAIQGIQVEETETRMLMGTASPGSDPQLKMTLVTHVWAPAEREFLRLPVLRELAGVSRWIGQYTAAASPLFTAIPGEVDASAVVLRADMQIHMSMPGATETGGDPNAPLFEAKVEVRELSTDPLEDAMFRIPPDYKPADAEASIRAFAAGWNAAPSASEATPPAAPAGAARVEAYVPILFPVHQTDPAYPAAARAQDIQGNVDLLVTLDAQGDVTAAEALGGPQVLRQAAIDAVRQWKYRPVLRDGKPVPAYTDANVLFINPDHHGKLQFAPMDLKDTMSAGQRREQLEQQFPRAPRQVLADLEQDAGGRDADQHFAQLDELAYAALDARDSEKAAAYAQELLAGAGSHAGDWNEGNAINVGHTVLGIVALAADDLAGAREHLLASGKTKGSPQLDSFGPNMRLAKELLARGESGAVLQYLDECRGFWKMGTARLDAWSEAIKQGKTPNFAMNLR